MAKKPPTPPAPDFDDFDPEADLNADIAPIDDAALLSEEEPELVAADDDLIVGEIEVEDDALADVVADKSDGATQLVSNTDDILLPDVEVDDAEVIQPDSVDVDSVEIDPDLVMAEDDAIIDPDEVSVTADEDFSPHDAETKASMPALDDDDPFAGVGEDLGAEKEVDADGELVGAGVAAGALDDPDEPYYEEEKPKPKTHWFAWTLIGLNIVAALVAPVMLVTAIQKRQEYTYAVFKYDLAMLGLPSEEEAKSLTASRATLPGHRIAPDDIKKIVTERVNAERSKQGGPGALTDRIEGFEEALVRRIPPSMLTKEILKDHFNYFGSDQFYVSTDEGKTWRSVASVPTVEDGKPEVKTVVTIEDEVRRVQKSLIPDIQSAAKDSYTLVANDPAKVKARIERMLHPLAMDTYQSEKLDKLIKNAKGPELEKLYLEAAERRMAFDFLLPLELFRPGDSKTLFVEKIGDLDALPVKAVLDRAEERLGSTIGKNYIPAIHLGEGWGQVERDTIEKRLSVAFTLLSLAHVNTPDGKLLYPKLLERIPLVVGKYDFALAAELFPGRLLKLNEKVLERIKIDREGFEVPDQAGANQLLSKAFIQYYEDELQRIRFVQNDIFKAKIRLKDLQDQKARYETLLAERKAQREDVLAKIAKARAKTAKDVAELRVFQNELHRYQVELATSEEDLARLSQEIQDKLGKAKGGK